MESSLTSIVFDFPGQTSCMGLPGTAIVGAQLILAIIGSLLGLIAGFLAAGLFFAAVIRLWFRRGERDRGVRLRVVCGGRHGISPPDMLDTFGALRVLQRSGDL